jgi:hypothetical protein
MLDPLVWLHHAVPVSDLEASSHLRGQSDLRRALQAQVVRCDRIGFSGRSWPCIRFH